MYTHSGKSRHRSPLPAKVAVTSDDIKNGRKLDERACPIVLATRRAFERQFGKKPVNFFAGWDEVLVEIREGHSHMKLTAPIRDWIDRYDNDEPVSGFVMERGHAGWYSLRDGGRK